MIIIFNSKSHSITYTVACCTIQYTCTYVHCTCIWTSNTFCISVYNATCKLSTLNFMLCKLIIQQHSKKTVYNVQDHIYMYIYMYMYIHTCTYRKNHFPLMSAWIYSHTSIKFILLLCLIHVHVPVVACLDHDQSLALFQSMESISYSQDPDNNQTQYPD